MAESPSVTQEPSGSGGSVSNGEDNNRGRVPASKASIEAMRRMKVEGGGDCSICLEEFKEDEEDSEMPCKHVFHSGCVEKWLQMNGSCPICRFLMPPEEGASSGLGSGGGQIDPQLRQMLLRVSSLANSIGWMVSGRTQVDDDDSLAQD
ncbi:putative Ribosomal protein L34e superfamily protein [Hibiscus syriacus]|uniref:RING-type E3 ubiquitin transferase n=1 Tax=Hibiscus syriacus TaxID=106335 RepID=A0A6A2WCB2_HIBSY|nr:E3 ubiquitin-protein ligase MPSR1-like [Hibiscus syriacus]KAE8655772.1 putative Ribosomal protein L34e superfamily protein [Hibiscus syriacus]